MALSWPSKDPDEVLDFNVNWADTDEPVLEDGEIIVDSTFTVVVGSVVRDSDDFEPSGLATVWLSGGVLGELCEVLNRITTSAGRTYDQTCKLRIRKH